MWEKSTPVWDIAHCVCAANVSRVFYTDMDGGLYCWFNPSKADGGVMEVKNEKITAVREEKKNQSSNILMFSLSTYSYTADLTQTKPQTHMHAHTHRQISTHLVQSTHKNTRVPASHLCISTCAAPSIAESITHRSVCTTSKFTSNPAKVIPYCAVVSSCSVYVCLRTCICTASALTLHKTMKQKCMHVSVYSQKHSRMFLLSYSGALHINILTQVIFFCFTYADTLKTNVRRGKKVGRHSSSETENLSSFLSRLAGYPVVSLSLPDA